MNGSFQIPGKYRMLFNTITISCIGFYTKKVFMNEFIENKLNIIKLNESVTHLAEIEIKSKRISHINAIGIIRSAINNIPYHYSNSPVFQRSNIDYSNYWMNTPLIK